MTARDVRRDALEGTLQLFARPDVRMPDWLWLAFEETRKCVTRDAVAASTSNSRC